MKFFKNGDWGIKLLSLILAIVLYHSLKHGTENEQETNGNGRSIFQYR